MKKNCTNFIISGVLFLMFAVFTVLVMRFDVMPIGPEESSVGFATANAFLLKKISVNLMWYELTNWLGFVAILTAICFGIIGLVQLYRRRSLFEVDIDILALGVLYFIIVAAYALFELYIVNYRPILLHGSLEASFPSSHIMIVLSVLGTAIIQFQKRINNYLSRKILEFIAGGIIILTVVGRLISGVHWFTDIVAGLLLGATLIMFYKSVLQYIE